MKRIFGIMAILLIWTGSANAGQLKVMVPVDEFEQLESRLAALEQENSQLQQEVKSLAEKPSEKKMGSQVDALVQENNQLKQEVESLAEKSSAEAASSKGMDTRLGALGRENRQLKRSVASLKEEGALLRSDKRTARHVYFERNKKFSSHIFK